MKAPRFSYVRPETVSDALELLASYGGDASVLAGGQSLGPMLNFRVVQPQVLVDINRIPGLGGISIASEHIRIGALTRHSEIETSSEIARHLPLLSRAILDVAHPAIRNRGTFGGSCALADPSAELPACSLALNARFVIVGPKGERRVPANEFFRGLYATALETGELLLAIEFPLSKPGYASAFGEFARRQGDFAMVGVAVHGSTASGQFSDLRIALFGLGDRPVRVPLLERELEGRSTTSEEIIRALPALESELDPTANLQASIPTKKHLARVLTGRVLEQLSRS